MKQQYTLTPKRCVQLEVLTMPIDLIAARLEALASGDDILNLDSDGTPQANPDATVLGTRGDYTITISTPSCNVPKLNEHSESILNWTLSGIEIRASILFAVTDYLIARYPAIMDGKTNTGASLEAIAKSCDLPITDVSRALADKYLLTRSGRFAYSSLLGGQPDSNGT